MSSRLAIVGIGIHAFGRTPDRTGRQQGQVAARRALADAGITWDQIQFAIGGSDSSGNADAMVADLGLTGLSFLNVINGCATGGAALSAASWALASGDFECGLVVGFDKHPAGAFNADPEQYSLGQWYGETGLMLTTQYFGMKIQRYAYDHRISTSTLAKVAEKAFLNGSKNPNAWRRQLLSADEILQSTMVSDPLTKYMFCSPAEGAVALVVCRADLAHRYSAKPIFLKSSIMTTRRYGSFEVFSPGLAPEIVSSPSRDAARLAFEKSGLGPTDIDVIQLQDTDSGAEVIHMAECGFCEDGEQEELIQSGETALTGRLPINTDGGCIANGEPIGASGLRQIHESVLQLRGAAGDRQVPGEPRTAFTHVYGAPGVSACAVLVR
ncbi:MAG: hypothetical protein RI958_1944 [Actinomycetota bacterium]|jgi:acetyl-CoA C-acetyltransferase